MKTVDELRIAFNNQERNAGGKRMYDSTFEMDMIEAYKASTNKTRLCKTVGIPTQTISKWITKDKDPMKKIVVGNKRATLNYSMDELLKLKDEYTRIKNIFNSLRIDLEN